MKRGSPSGPARGQRTGSARRPKITLALRKTAHAPVRPARAALERLLQRAWNSVPAARRRPAGAHRALAVDLWLVEDARIALLNARHLKHRGPTDVLSFPLGAFDPERGAWLLGEIVVSYQTARREAAARKLPYAEELARYVLHGFLHLVGYDDRTEREAKAMQTIQEHLLAHGAPRVERTEI